MQHGSKGEWCLGVPVYHYGVRYHFGSFGSSDSTNVLERFYDVFFRLEHA
jgi:hypothetical protein